ncbi:carbamoyl-phosphate synthase small subunit [Anopheles sinensis]|uniref:Carbamoyl-phosphate synthase small subunit n=1 Tax=Anopheles sinensis TaxID=74873 RepID=A0A084VGA9_ANOSI|nr:carbamoyl-phosphate synthase small subunit [Anopheles sinensis]
MRGGSPRQRIEISTTGTEAIPVPATSATVSISCRTQSHRKQLPKWFSPDQVSVRQLEVAELSLDTVHWTRPLAQVVVLGVQVVLGVSGCGRVMVTFRNVGYGIRSKAVTTYSVLRSKETIPSKPCSQTEPCQKVLPIGHPERIEY